MRNYGHRFATGVVGCFFISIGCIIRNCLGIDFLKYFENIGINKNIVFAVLAPLSVAIAAALDDLVEKHNLTIEKRDMMYFSIMIGSIIIAALSFLFV
nr:hypothetical protein [Treponema sp.]